MVYQEVTRNKTLSPAAKGLYAYLSSFCGTSDECYPSVIQQIKRCLFRHIKTGLL